jgi:hypothetical protein
MKIMITGHTSGLGKFLSDQFLNEGHTVVGISRSTGVDLSTTVEGAIALAKDCDLVVLNSNAGQLELLERLSLQNQIIVMGSIAGQYDQLIQSEYSNKKKKLAERCKNLSLNPTTKILHLTISMLEDAVSTDKGISFLSVYQTINSWLANPCYNNIDYEFKLTPFTLEQIKSKFGATQESIDRITQNVCDRTKAQILPTA